MIYALVFIQEDGSYRRGPCFDTIKGAKISKAAAEKINTRCNCFIKDFENSKVATEYCKVYKK